MRVAGLMWAMLGLAGAANAAPPPEPLDARLEAVDRAGREIVAYGVTMALSSTVTIQVPGRPRATLGDIAPGMNVRLELAAGDSEVLVVRSITVLPD